MNVDDMMVIKEEPLIYYVGCCPQFGQEIAIFAKDLRDAKLGDTWECEDQDRHPNRESCWTVSYKLVYKDEHGCLVIYRNEEPGNEQVKMVWVELA